MADKPIIFSPPMVCAILEGRKTQTRRVIDPQPPEEADIFGPEMYAPTAVDRYGNEYPGDKIFGVYDYDGEWGVKCPYGKPGDLLWVRENCQARELPSGLDGVFYPADNGFREIENTPEQAEAWVLLNSYRGERGAIVPSIHMPRWASRLTLRLTDVRVERVQDISAQDCIAEGIQIPVSKETGGVLLDLTGKYPVCRYINENTARIFQDGTGCDDYAIKDITRAYFASLWDSINAERGYGWEQNPWVWCLTFEVIHKNVDAVLAEQEENSAVAHA